MNTQIFKNNNQKFPLSTEALDFMQKQTELVYRLTELAGSNIIVTQPSVSGAGLVIFDGELLPLAGTVPQTATGQYIYIIETPESMSVADTFDGIVRKTRIAYYGNSSTSYGYTRKLVSRFTALKSISTLMSELATAQQHYVPTGAIMMWSGTIANIPTGWALCNGQNGTPDLQGRFIVGASTGVVMFDSKGYNYPVGSTGGKNEVALTESQMPQHGAHLYHDENEWKAYADNYNSTTEGGPSTEKRYLEISALKRYDDSPWQNRGWLQEHGNEAFPSRWKRGGNQPHENRPVFYALAYIMKII